MADKQPEHPESEMIGLTRVIEYYGPKEWIDKVIQHSRIPLNGVRFFGADGTAPEDRPSIRSGVVMWGQMTPEEAAGEKKEPLTFPMPGGKPS